MPTAEFPPELVEKLTIVQKELGASDMISALDKSLNIAHFVTQVLQDKRSRLLVEHEGKYEQVTDFT